MTRFTRHDPSSSSNSWPAKSRSRRSTACALYSTEPTDLPASLASSPSSSGTPLSAPAARLGERDRRAAAARSSGVSSKRPARRARSSASSGGSSAAPTTGGGAVSVASAAGGGAAAASPAAGSGSPSRGSRHRRLFPWTKAAINPLPVGDGAADRRDRARLRVRSGPVFSALRFFFRGAAGGELGCPRGERLGDALLKRLGCWGTQLAAAAFCSGTRNSAIPPLGRARGVGSRPRAGSDGGRTAPTTSAARLVSRGAGLGGAVAGVDA